METFKMNLKINWHNLVWNRLSIPKARFCCWLVALGKLKTKDQLHSIGVVDDDLCPLCATSRETIRHLFFDCLFSIQCVEDMAKWVGIKFKPLIAMDFRRFKLNKFQQNIMCANYTSTIYAIWQCRNAAVWNSVVKHLHTSSEASNMR